MGEQDRVVSIWRRNGDTGLRRRPMAARRDATRGGKAARRALVALCVVLAGPLPALAQPALECVADRAAGFAWDGTDWLPTTPDPSSRYTIEPLAQEVVFLRGREYTYRVFPHHEPAADLLCEHAPPFRDTGARLYCGDVISGFVFDFDTSRFTAFFTSGFVDGDENEFPRSPRMEIGTCAAVDVPR